MVNVGSLPSVGSALFDLDSQAGITAVLLAIRASDIAAAEKNDLRDLVFLYTNGGKDQSVRFSLEKKIAAVGLTPVAQKEKASAVSTPKRPMPTIGTFRSTPAFSIPTPPPVTPPVSPVATTVNPVVTSVHSEPEPTRPAPLFSANRPVPAEEEVAPSQPDVVVPPVAMPKADQKQYLERIREIKSLVNEKVGNPVNLVDISNEVGREYMSALLDAMKRINSGMSADVAMQRLEAAYASVEETLRSVGSDVVAQSVPVAPQPAPVFTPPEPMPAPTYAAPLPKPEPLPVYKPIVQEERVTPVPPPPSYEPVVPPAPVYQSVPVQPVMQTPSYASVTPAHGTSVPPTFSSLADMVQQSHAQAGFKTTPVAQAPIQSGDPLLGADVEEGLNQLLSEWSIFKKSGIFGSGPKGREHPLYKKMAELQIPLLLAGRFEGATQEVRQSLTDYMNGWRYEQGLIYEKGETFEHYLRRVILHILEQNAR